jgi:hypothetical protein
MTEAKKKQNESLIIPRPIVGGLGHLETLSENRGDVWAGKARFFLLHGRELGGNIPHFRCDDAWVLCYSSRPHVKQAFG